MRARREPWRGAALLRAVGPEVGTPPGPPGPAAGAALPPLLALGCRRDDCSGPDSGTVLRPSRVQARLNVTPAASLHAEEHQPAVSGHDVVGDREREERAAEAEARATRTPRRPRVASALDVRDSERQDPVTVLIRACWKGLRLSGNRKFAGVPPVRMVRSLSGPNRGRIEEEEEGRLSATGFEPDESDRGGRFCAFKPLRRLPVAGREASGPCGCRRRPRRRRQARFRLPPGFPAGSRSRTRAGSDGTGCSALPRLRPSPQCRRSRRPGASS